MNTNITKTQDCYHLNEFPKLATKLQVWHERDYMRIGGIGPAIFSTKDASPRSIGYANVVSTAVDAMTEFWKLYQSAQRLKDWLLTESTNDFDVANHVWMPFVAALEMSEAAFKDYAMHVTVANGEKYYDVFQKPF